MEEVMKKEEKKPFKKKSEGLSIEDKKKAILESKMPEAQKEAYLKELSGEKKVKEGVSFLVYAKIKKIPLNMQGAMLVFPKAKGVEVATLKQWDEIFKDF